MKHDPILLVGASGATTLQGTYEIVKGIAGELMFWVSFATAIVLMFRVIRRVFHWIATWWRERRQ